MRASGRNGIWAIGWLLMSCGGSAWMEQPLPDSDDENYEPTAVPPPEASPRRARQDRSAVEARPAPDPAEPSQPVVKAQPRMQGKVLGTFRNTYYDFPSEREADPKGARVDVMDPQCKPIKAVPRAFYESLCVQGSGTLSSGVTVAFAKRDCDCAEVCPRTTQKICFEALDPAKFPWGRGATGRPIVPLLTVAVDSDVIPLGTAIYIPQYDGLPRDEVGSEKHDGCFVAQDRGIRIQGQQVDVFTGHPSVTKLYNRLVPSNQGVTVVVDNPRCARATQD
jgi:3D (Asp-Asp-Asp) domain-containing protein